MNALTGHCLCGAVTFRAASVSPEIHLCHCGMCARQSGGPAYAVDAGSDVDFGGAEKIHRFRSSERAERAFCSECGSILYFRLIPDGAYFIGPGLFDDQSGFRLTDEIYVDDRTSWAPVLPGVRQCTGAEIETAFAEEGEL